MSKETDPQAVAADAGEDGRLRRRLEAFTDELDRLESAPAFAKSRYQTQVYRLAAELLDSDGGVRALLDLAPRYTAAGVFHGGPWEKAAKLLPRLVGLGLQGEGVYPTVEALSELRMLAIVRGIHDEPGLDPESAEKFLTDVCVENIDLMYPSPGEASRGRPKLHRRAERLFALIREHISPGGFGAALIAEIEAVCDQRPIVTRHVRKLLDLAERLPDGTLAPAPRERFDFFRGATGPVAPAAAEAGSTAAYAAVLGRLPETDLASEADLFAHSAVETGLCSPYHAVLVRDLARRRHALLARALGLGKLGRACLDQNRGLVAELVESGLRPGTEAGVAGLALTLDRALLSRPEIRAGLRRLLDVRISPTAEKRLLALHEETDEDEPTPRNLLVSGALSVLGRPLGIGQGNNPTCQAARGLSLWSQHAPGLMLKIMVRAVRDGVLRCQFEQHDLVITEEPAESLAARLDLNLDPVSAVLVPMLDRLYTQLMHLAQARPHDPHKWVNPAMYGGWVPLGFAAAFTPLSGAVVEHREFLRTFFASHHPRYNGGYDLLYPNPVGIVITDVHGNMLGYHAVSIQRIAADPAGRMRVYFFNPNNEGRQRWGQGVSPTVVGKGEQPGESSLPFGEFASRLYAFHFDPYEKLENRTIPAEVIEKITTLARESWGRDVNWQEPA